MAEYIDRANLIARIEYYATHTTEGKGEHYAYSVVLNEVLNRPAADVVPVSELLTLRDALYENDQITMRGLARLNMLIAKYGGYDHG